MDYKSNGISNGMDSKLNNGRQKLDPKTKTVTWICFGICVLCLIFMVYQKGGFDFKPAGPSKDIIKTDVKATLDASTIYDLDIYGVTYDKDLDLYTVKLSCEYDYVYMNGYTPKLGKTVSFLKAEYRKDKGNWELVSLNLD